ncbi:HSD17B11 (predicted) [Pycnogonum litorale]
MSETVFLIFNVLWNFLEFVQLNIQIVACILSNIYRKICPMPRKSVNGKVIVITGAANGLGRELCIQFTKLGASVIALDIDQGKLLTLKSEIQIDKGSIVTYVCDVTSEDHVKRTASKILQDDTNVDILVNNAGVTNIRQITQLDANQLRKIFNVNVISHFYTINAFLPSMIRKRNGHIVSMSSSAGWIGVTKHTDYCATKYAGIGLMDALRQELHDHKQDYIKLTTVSPFFVDTGLWKVVKSRNIKRN